MSNNGEALDADHASLFDTKAVPLAPLSPDLEALLQENQDIPMGAVCSHPLSVVRDDVPPGQKPSNDTGRRHCQEKHDAIDAQIGEWMNCGVVEHCLPASP